MGKLVVVTGGAGFIGSHLCERLVKEGSTVISLDNYFSGSRENHVPGVEYREGHTKDIAKLVPENPDLIFHLGEYSRVAKSLEEPATVFELNMIGTFGVLEFWRNRSTKLVYAGSSTKAVGPRADGTYGRELAPYTWAKAANSELVENYRRWYDLSGVIAYFYNVYGPRERAEVGQYGTVIETFRQQYARGMPLTVRSPGTQKRAFTHVDDTVAALALIGEKANEGEFGIAAVEQYSLLEVASLFGGRVEMLAPTPTTRSDAGPIDTTALQALGWKQTKTLTDYIAAAKRTQI